MQFSALILTLLSSTALVSAEQYFYKCEFAKDNSGMIQHPYCCDDFAPAHHTTKATEGKGCQKMEDVVFECPGGRGDVACCYEIGPGQVCTSYAQYLTEEEM